MRDATSLQTVLNATSGALLGALLLASPSFASEAEKPRDIEYPPSISAPASQSQEEVDAKSDGCVSCHTSSDRKTMHRSGSVDLGCVDCHGGDAGVFNPPGSEMHSEPYDEAKHRSHVQPRYPETWGLEGDHAERPVRTYTLYNREAQQYIRFRNPGDFRAAEEACGACHQQIVDANLRSLMATNAMFWNGAAYNNGILPGKRPIVGEAYSPDGVPIMLKAPDDFPWTPEYTKAGVIPSIVPLPAWETIPPADNFRVFERGGRNITNLFPEVGLPNRFEEPGRPDIRQSNRGPGTGGRISVPVLNLHKTRLNDPNLWFEGTKDNPGDFRGSGCSGCHVIYANDRDPISAGIYAKYGHWGQTATDDPTINSRKDQHGEPEHGWPIRHEFTRAIPTSQCMTCHMHQPNMFVNSYLGFTMWDYESDAPLMWPEEQRHPTSEERAHILERNPEEAAIRGSWGDLDFLGRVWDDVNPKAKDTQFADYHGHGWNFRAIFKRDRDGTLLDAKNNAIPDDMPSEEKWKLAVHMRDIHADKGMQCADCHFAQDAHGNGLMYGEVAAAVEIRCRDCHGTTAERANLRTSGPAAPKGGNDLRSMRNMDGRARFRVKDKKIYQRLIMPPHKELQIKQVLDSITPGNRDYNEKSHRAKTVAKGSPEVWGKQADSCERAHDEDEISCYACHSSWVTSCAGCHLPIQANAKTDRHHFEGGESRNFATYNPQVARDQIFQLGVHGEAKDGIIVPVRSSSALLLSSTDSNRNRIYVQQQPSSSAGYSAQAFAPHFPHTVRTTETKQCSNCHVADAKDNNALMAQTLILGTNFVNFVGFNAFVGSEEHVSAVQVTEWDEPQAVIGSYLQRHAYPDWYREHLDRDRELTTPTPGDLDADPGWIASLRGFLQSTFAGRAIYDGTYGHNSGTVGCLQLRGEYLYVAEGKKGMRVYDVSSVANKGFSERIISSPFSPLGQNIRVNTKNATCVALPTNQLVRPEKNRQKLESDRIAKRDGTPEDLEQAMHAVYSYAAITDSKEGLILVDTETMGDFEPRNNFLKRALTWNPGGALDGARHATFAGHILYVSGDKGVAVVDLDNPLEPKLLTTIELPRARASMLQFRYLFVVNENGMQVVDVTVPASPRIVEGAQIPVAEAHQVFVSRTYAYIAAGSEGLVIVDVERPESPEVYKRYNANGKLSDARDVIVATTNASLFAYVADGKNGLKVIQLTSPESQPKFYGFSPEPKPELIAWRKLGSPALSLSRPLERDRGVDETGHQIAVFGRIGSRPFNLEEMQRLYLNDGKLWTVSDETKPSKRAIKSASGDCQPR